jgi:hypothetical protein
VCYSVCLHGRYENGNGRRLEQIWDDSPRIQSYTTSLLQLLPTTLAEALSSDLEIRHGLLLGFAAAMAVLICLSVSRVLHHATVRTSPRKRLSALSKLATPALLVVAPLLLPNTLLTNETRLVSLVVGLALCLVTIKLIVFGMAKRSYATVQFDAVPALLVLAWMRVDARFTDRGRHALLVVTTVWYLLRIYSWTASAIRQICQRLDIYLFTIKSSSIHDQNQNQNPSKGK